MQLLLLIHVEERVRCNRHRNEPSCLVGEHRHIPTPFGEEVAEFDPPPPDADVVNDDETPALFDLGDSSMFVLSEEAMAHSTLHTSFTR
ncbi:hypothetical protein AMTR_s00052p00141980 [Amborella trichopoda]|uniref:Uncharacterized protein n=1 Tax=Amborella trichopoda TaxID=13333 RepID=U5CT14_AMBTC|nr:hypothetical protein AMTR_s00052p00141980 [Amborella trichopoda]